MKLSGQLQATAAITLGKLPTYPMNKNFVGPIVVLVFVHEREIYSLAGNKTPDPPAHIA